MKPFLPEMIRDPVKDWTVRAPIWRVSVFVVKKANRGTETGHNGFAKSAPGPQVLNITGVSLTCS